VTDQIMQTPVRSYIGWLDDISWPDEWPNPIGDAVIEGLATLFNGQTVDDCQSELESQFENAHATYRTQGPSRMADDRVLFAKMCALYWRQRVDVRGDGQATI
jgi:hypothetical protein